MKKPPRKKAGERDCYFMFTPMPNMPRYALHLWRMRDATVVGYLDIEEFPPSNFVFVNGDAQPVPPQELLDRVDALTRSGIEVNVPLGWRATATLHSLLSKAGGE